MTTHDVAMLIQELAITKDELDRQKEANNRAPMTTMKNLVGRLKQQLHEKEKQQQVGQFIE